MPGTQGGLRLSYATLGAFIKYPKASLPYKSSSHIADKKFGFFQSQASFFDQLSEELSTKQKGKVMRHPLTYLVEAADDICYTIIDFEDGINLGWIPEDYALEYLIKLVKDQIDGKKYAQLAFTSQRLSYLRALAINSLIHEAVTRFSKFEPEILAGTFEQSLLDKSQFQAQMNDIIQLSIKKVYQSKEVIQKEVVGHRALSILLEHYTRAAVNAFKGNTHVQDRLLLSLLPEGVPMAGTTLYETLLNASCFVASLSDGKALQLARDIGG
jgi:dGTPase